MTDNKTIDTSAAKSLARNAIRRATKGVMYGDDMISSTEICLLDAIELLSLALKEIKEQRLK